jgi:NADPH:quinone reductase-like Zn-dependent oxidoreductase
MTTRRGEAWFLHPGESEKPTRAKLVREPIELSAPTGREVIVKPLYGCWEGNMGHAMNRKPVDICKQRNEPKVVIGNAGVVRVMECGPDVENVEPGQTAIIFCTGIEDSFGYPEKIMAYDAPGTMGCLSTVMKMTDRQLIPVPERTRHSLPQWAAFSLRYITAWSNWDLAFGVFRLSIGEQEMLQPHVWSWGGGVSLAELDLAHRYGCKTVMLSGNDHHLAKIPQWRITAIDRRKFGEVNCDEKRIKIDADYRKQYREIENAFLEEVRRRTDGQMVQVFIDYVGSPVYRLTLKALSRQGVITTAGWKEGMEIWHLRAKECIERHQHVYTHYARYPQGKKAVLFAELNDWMPTVDEKIYGFDDIPQLAEDYEDGKTDYFPCFSINPV